MKAKYIFIHADAEITTETVFYTVMLGQSKEDKAILAQCQSLRFLTSCYFQRYSADVSNYLCRIAESLFPGVTLPLLRLQRQVVNGREFKRILQTKVFNVQPSTPGIAQTLCQLEPMFYHKHTQLWNRK